MKRTKANWEEIEENNKLIATFLGYEYVPFNKELNVGNHFDVNPPGWRAKDFKNLKLGGYLCRKHRDLKFHDDWNWLMSVVEKIENLDTHSRVTHSYSVEITGNGTTIRPNVWAGDRWIIRFNARNKRKECTYSAVVQFIKKYEELKIHDYE